MKKRALIIVGVFLLLSINAIAQDPNDPGEPDTVFIRSNAYVPYDSTGTFVYVYVDFVTDNYVGGVFIPLTWTSFDDEIYPGSLIFYSELLWQCEHYDTLLFDERILSICAWCEEPFNTFGQRVNALRLRFTITPDAEEQYVFIDTTCDPINGHLIFGDTLGMIEYTPIFYAGGFTYGEPTGMDEGDLPIPKSYGLYQNYPNPFNTNTNIEFALPRACHVIIEIFNILGQNVSELVSKQMEAGYHTVSWDGTTNDGEEAPSGLYFYRLRTDYFVQTKKMVMLR
jgi:hypothetical protein